MRTAVWFIAIVGALLVLGAVALWIIAIWTVGADSGRYAGSGAVLAVIGAPAVLGAAVWLDLDRISR